MARRIITPAQLSEAQKQFEQAKARLLDLKAQAKATARRDKKKLDDRRKILVSACALNLMQTDPQFKALFSVRLKTFLTRDIDRAIFPDLP